MHPLSVATALVALALLVTHGSGAELQPEWTRSALAILDRAASALQGLQGGSDFRNRLLTVVQSYRFRLRNHRVYERSPKELVENLIDKVRAAASGAMDTTGIDTMLEMLLQSAPPAWHPGSQTTTSASQCDTDAPEVALNELSSSCKPQHGNLNGCFEATTRYCDRVKVPGKRLVGNVINICGGLVKLACMDGVAQNPIDVLILVANKKRYCDNINQPFCQQAGADNYCIQKYGSGYSGIVYLNTVSAGTLPKAQYVCIKIAKREWVPFTVLASLSQDCKDAQPDPKNKLAEAASIFCKRFNGHAGGMLQNMRINVQTLLPDFEVTCHDADYTGDAYINKDIKFYEAKSTLKNVCSLDFQVDSGKILNSAPDDLKVETYDNRRSSVELRDSFTISRSVTTENSFSHSHSMTIGAELTVKSGIPFIAQSEIKVSSSYTAQFSMGTVNRRTTEYSQTSEVVVPPGHAIRKKATITRSNMNVPWKARGVNKLGKVVTLTGTWSGVDVSDVRVTQEDL